MQHRTIRRNRRWLLLTLLALLGLAAACSSDSDSGSSDTTGSDATSSEGAAAPADPDQITIGYQAIPNGDLIVKNQGLLEEAFPDTEIEWKLFASGGDVNEAILGDSIDIGLAGSSPVSRGLSSGIEYQVPWIFDVIGEAESLVVDPTAATSIEELAGLTIATPFASTSHYSLLAALEGAGVDPGDVDIIDAEPDDVYAAWSRGDIDGAYVWNPNLANIIADGGEVLITSADLAEQGVVTYDLAVVANSFADEFPEAVQTWVDIQNQAIALINDDPDAAAEAIAAELDIEPDEALAQLEDLIFLDAAAQAAADQLGGGLAETLQSTAEFNVDQGEIDEAAPADVFAAAVIATFAESAG